MGMQATTTKLTYARNDYIKQGRSHIFDRVGDMIYYACLQQFGKEYWVDATSGSSSNNGGDYLSALDTIGDAITLSNADVATTANHANKIFVLGGTYGEDLAGAKQCDVIGIGQSWGAGVAISGKVVCNNIQAMRLYNLGITTDGSEATVMTSGGIAPHSFEMHNCGIGMSASETYGFHMYGDAYGVKIVDCRFTGDHDYGIYIQGKCIGLQIIGNYIGAKTCGIYFKQGVTSDQNSMIKDNVILREAGATALTTGIDFAMTDRTPNVKVIHNWIAAGDAIHYGSTSDPTFVEELSCIDNHTVSSAVGTGVIETPES